MKLKFICLIIISLFIVCFTFGCDYEQPDEEFVAQAKEETINYIKGKYGFEPKISSVKEEKSYSNEPFSSKEYTTGYANVECKYNNVKFKVRIGVDTDVEYAEDNYQYKEIVSDVKEYINSKTKIEPYKISISYGYNEDGKVQDIYKKDNIEEFINNNYFEIQIEYINSKNLEFFKEEKLFNNIKKADIKAVNFHSLNAYKKSSTHKYKSEIDFIVNAINIESCYYSNYKTENSYTFEEKKVDDFYFFGDDADKFKDLTFKKTSVDIKDWKDKKTLKKIYYSYIINGSLPERIEVYIPKSKLSTHNLMKYNIGLECNNEYYTYTMHSYDKYLNTLVPTHVCKDSKTAKIVLATY